MRSVNSLLAKVWTPVNPLGPVIWVKSGPGYLVTGWGAAVTSVRVRHCLQGTVSFLYRWHHHWACAGLGTDDDVKDGRYATCRSAQILHNAMHVCERDLAPGPQINHKPKEWEVPHPTHTHAHTHTRTHARPLIWLPLAASQWQQNHMGWAHAHTHHCILFKWCMDVCASDVCASDVCVYVWEWGCVVQWRTSESVDTLKKQACLVWGGIFENENKLYCEK